MLTVVTGYLAKHIQSVFGALCKEGFRFQQYIPCLDPLGEDRGGQGYSLSPEEYAPPWNKKLTPPSAVPAVCSSKTARFQARRGGGFMPPLSILVKPASSACNLRCAYCFYADEASNRAVSSYGRMSPQVVRALLEQTAVPDAVALVDGAGHPFRLPVLAGVVEAHQGAVLRHPLLLLLQHLPHQLSSTPTWTATRKSIKSAFP